MKLTALSTSFVTPNVAISRDLYVTQFKANLFLTAAGTSAFNSPKKS